LTLIDGDGDGTQTTCSSGGSFPDVLKLLVFVAYSSILLYLQFTLESALKKVKAAEDAWNTGNPQIVANAYTPVTKRIYIVDHSQARIESLKQSHFVINS
jgi:hypothetical protein